MEEEAVCWFGIGFVLEKLFGGLDNGDLPRRWYSSFMGGKTPTFTCVEEHTARKFQDLTSVMKVLVGECFGWD
jgi:hypothetical protein